MARLQTYVADAQNKVRRISKTYSGISTYAIQMSNNVQSINVLESNPGTQAAQYQSIVFGKNVKDILTGCMKDCINLKNAVFQGDIKTIGPYAFYNCRSLVSIRFPKTLTSIGEYAFYGCASFGTVSFDPSSTVTIGLNAFYGASFESLDVHVNGAIGQTAFGNNALLRSVKITGCDEIPAGCFRDCPKLTSVSLPTTIKTIGANAFLGCSSLEELDLSRTSLTKIEDNAFSGTQITSLKLPATFNSYTCFSSNALKGSAITNIYLAGMTDQYMKDNAEHFTDFGAGHNISFETPSKVIYGLDDSLDGLKNQKVYVVSVSHNPDILWGMSNDSNRLRNMLREAYGNDYSKLVTFVQLSHEERPEDAEKFIPSSGVIYPSKENVLEAIQEAKKTNPGLFIFHFSDHGTGGGGIGKKADIAALSYSMNLLDNDESGLLGKGLRYKELFHACMPEEDARFDRIIFIFCCCHPSRKFIPVNDDLEPIDPSSTDPKVLMYSADDSFRVTQMVTNEGHKLMSLLLYAFSKDKTYAQFWTAATTRYYKEGSKRIKTPWSKYYRYNVDGGAVTSNKSNYNNFDETQLMFR